MNWNGCRKEINYGHRNSHRGNPNSIALSEMVEEMERKKKKVVHKLHIQLGGINLCSCGEWNFYSKDARKIRREFKKHKAETK